MRDPGGSETVAIRFERFSCRYGPALPPVLQDVDLDIGQGECVFVLGAGGAGKTTLGLAIAGVIPHVRGRTEGSVSIFGQPTTHYTLPQLAQRVGIVFQDVESQLCMLRVRDEVAFGPENFRVERHEVLRRVDEALEFVGLSGMQDRAVFELSGGEKQKVALAAVLAGRPDILFLDEPAANLDPRSTAEIVDIVRRLKGTRTILVFENKVDDFLPEADRLVVLHNGRVALDGPPRTVLAEHGQALVDEFGVWIPQPSALTLQLAPAARPLPLTVEEAVPVLAPLLPARAPDLNHRPSNTLPPLADAVPVAEVKSVSYRYDRERMPALQDVSLRIAEGEWLALVGPNGSGKTTLAKHLIGLLKPQSGSVRILGKDTHAASVRELARLVGYVFQNPEHQFVADAVEDELFFSLRAAGAPEDTLAERVRETVAHFDLGGLERRHPYSLSGGEKRRLSVATMLITRPRLLILDEPTYGLDRRSTQQVMRAVEEAAHRRDDPSIQALGPTPDATGRDLLAGLGPHSRATPVGPELTAIQSSARVERAPGLGPTQDAHPVALQAAARVERAAATLVMVTHDMRLVAEYATSAAVMSGGRLVYRGSVEGLFEDEDLLVRCSLDVPPFARLDHLLGQAGKMLPRAAALAAVG